MVNDKNNKKEYLKALANNIKAKRNNKGFSQEKTAWLSGISYKFFQDIEGGKKDLTTYNLWKLCMALDISPNDILPSIREECLNADDK